MKAYGIALTHTETGQPTGYYCAVPGADYSGCQETMTYPRLTLFLNKEDAEAVRGYNNQPNGYFSLCHWQGLLFEVDIPDIDEARLLPAFQPSISPSTFPSSHTSHESRATSHSPLAPAHA